MEAGLLDYLKNGMKGVGSSTSEAGAGEIEMDKAQAVEDEAKRKEKWGGISKDLFASAKESAPTVGSVQMPGTFQSQQINPQFQNILGADPAIEALKRLQYGYGK